MVTEVVSGKIHVHRDYDYIFELGILQNKTMKYSRSCDSTTSDSGINECLTDPFILETVTEENC